MNAPLTVVWISDFPIEWLSDLPATLKGLPRRHPATWEIVLLSEFEKNPNLRVHVVALRHRIERDFSFDRNGVTFHILKAHPYTRLASLFLLDTLLIRRLCRRLNPQLIHAWGTEKGASVIANRLPYPYVMTVQGLYGWYKQRIRLGVYDQFIERLERIYLPRAPVVTTESDFAVRFLRERYPRLRVHQAEHAPNQSFFRIARQPELEPVRFITVGGLGHRKGTDLLFKSLDELSPQLNFKLTLLTNPTTQYIQSLRASVSANFWNRIEFKYQLLPHEVAAQLGSATMLLLPTRVDTSPNAVKEAVVTGLPVVSSNVGGIPDYVFPEKNGLLGSPGNQAEFREAVRRACSHPLFSRGMVDPQTLTQTRDYLSPERMARNFLGAYELALQAQTKGTA